MNKLSRFMAALIGIFLTFNGLQLVILPQTATKNFFISASGIAGLSTVRADLGGIIAALGLTILVGLRRGSSPTVLIVPATIIASTAIARLVGFALDGMVFHSMIAFVAEVLFASVLITASRGSNGRPTD